MFRRPRSRQSILFAVVVLLCAALPAVAVVLTESSAGAAPTLDHFQCYDAQSIPMPSGAPSFPSTAPAVQLNRSPAATFLPPSFLAATGPVFMHCNPVQKQIGSLPPTTITNPSAHLVCWRLLPNKVALPTTPVSFTNQFGTGALVLKSAFSLCVPSFKSLTVANLPPGTAPSGLDHFACFTATNPVGTPSFKPPASVTLTDQFFAHPTTVGAPNLLCSPTSKVLVPPTGTPIVNPNHFLVCFVIPPSTAYSPKVVFAKNQFGIGSEVAIANRELCVPSTNP